MLCSISYVEKTYQCSSGEYIIIMFKSKISHNVYLVFGQNVLAPNCSHKVSGVENGTGVLGFDPWKYEKGWPPFSE